MFRRLNKIALSVLPALVLASGGIPSVCAVGESTPGLVGIYFGDAERKNPKRFETVDSLETIWSEEKDHGDDWSGEFRGLLRGPFSGEIIFSVESNLEAALEIEGNIVCSLNEGEGKAIGSVELQRAEDYSLRLLLSKTKEKDPDFIRIRWSWDKQDLHSIPRDEIWFTSEVITDLQKDFPGLVPPPGHPPDVLTDGKHVIVYGESGRFAGWPTDHGVWGWGDEILVAFKEGAFKPQVDDHSIDLSRPIRILFARSMDGGETWKLEEPVGLEENAAPEPSPGGFDFTHPGFALKIRDDFFYATYDRGRKWEGPYELPRYGKKMTSRTHYLASGPTDCHLFLSAESDSPEGGQRDRAFCLRTTDGGKTFRFLSWMTLEPLEFQSATPSTVRLSKNHLLSAVRRKEMIRKGPRRVLGWIDIYESQNDGKSWGFVAKAAETDTGRRGGSPPAMVRLGDGRLCVTYGYRATPYGVRARTSDDEGKTWGPEIGLRADGRTFDVGYPGSVVRADGKVVTIYYISTEMFPEPHIEATIWAPQ